MKARLFTAPVTAAILMTLAPLIYFLPSLLGAIVLCPDDALTFGLPLRIAGAQMIHDGHLPLWNPYLFAGMPLLATGQSGLLFPLNWSFLLLDARVAMNFIVIASYSAAGLGAFLYAQRSGASLLGAIVTALVWQMCGASIGQISHTNIVHVFAVLPWVFWSIEGYVARPSGARAALISIFVALQVFAGHQQTLVYSLLLAGAYVIAHSVKEDNRSRRRAWLLSLCFIAVGLALAGVQILPTLELLRASLRQKSTYEFFSSFSMPPAFLRTYFAPFVLGGGAGNLFRAPYISQPYYSEYVGYVGLAPLILAVIAPLVRRDRKTLFWTGAALFCLALALGRSWPFRLYHIIYHVPILNLFRVPARHLMEVDFALAVLAGRGLTFLPNVRPSRRGALTTVVALSAFLLTWAVVTLLRPSEFRLARVAPVSILRAPELFLPLVLAGVSVWFLFRFARGRNFSGAGLVALIICDLALWGQCTDWRYHSPRRNHPIFRTPDVVRILQNEGLAPGSFRILTLDRTLASAVANASVTPGFDILLQPDIYMIHRIENAAGYDGFGLARYSRLAGNMKVWGEFENAPRSLLASRELDLLNVRYLIAPPSQNASEVPFPSTRWRETRRVGSLVVYENAQALPRAWLAPEARVLPDDQQLQVIRSGKLADGITWDPARTVLLDRPAETPLTANAAGEREVQIIRHDPNEVEITARTSSPAILVLADNHYPGWRVTVDGTRAALLRVDYNLRGVQLASGEHKVRFIYQPRSVALGSLISVVSAAGLALWCWRRA